MIDKIQALLDEILRTNRFYQERLGGRLAVGSMEEFSRLVPFTTKGDLVADQKQHPPYGSNHTYELSRYSRFCQTTGTTGRPLFLLDTAESWQWMLGNWAQIYRAAGVTNADRLYFGFSFGPFLGFWTAFEAATQLGMLSFPGGGLSTSARLRAIQEHGVSVLLCTPTYALHLGASARAEGLGGFAVKKIIVAGEPGGSVPQVRERISAAWNGARVIDHYGMSEVGPVTFENLAQPCVQQVIESSYYAEVIDPATGQPIQPGEVGELVLTTLGRTACPLLRYRTGDLVRCKGSALEGGIIGRADDMVVVRGVNIYPSSVDAVVRSVPGIGEYRVLVSNAGAMAELSLEIESEGSGVEAELARALSQAFSLRIPVNRVDTLPHFELKARRWIHTSSCNSKFKN